MLSPEVFASYSVTGARIARPAPPQVRSGQAHLFRSVIRQQAATGPNFAGHYTLVWIGCGAATVCPAIVDAIDGRVFFPPELGAVSALDTISDDDGFDIVNVRRDSRLLIVMGSPRETESRAGASYYEWRNDRLHLQRFVPLSRLCGTSKPAAAAR